MIRYLFLFVLSMILSVGCMAQRADMGFSRNKPTENIGKKELNKRSNRPKRKNYSVIYKKDLRGILYGNPCAVEATKKMGFIYELQPEGIPGSLSEKKTFYHNLGVNLKLIFTRSPFWKLILDKRIRDCRNKSGDIVG